MKSLVHWIRTLVHIFSKPIVRWLLLGVLVAAMIAIVAHPGSQHSEVNASFQDDPRQLAQQRSRTNLPPCIENGHHPLEATDVLPVQVRCMATGSQLTLGAALGNNLTLINVFSYSCAPCSAELPFIAEFAQRHADKFRVILLHRDQSDLEGLKLLAKKHIMLPALSDPTGIAAAKLGISNTIPQTVVVDHAGKIITIFPKTFHNLAAINAAVGLPPDP